jgi:hypothetical protein
MLQCSSACMDDEKSSSQRSVPYRFFLLYAFVTLANTT